MSVKAMIPIISLFTKRWQFGSANYAHMTRAAIRTVALVGRAKRSGKRLQIVVARRASAHDSVRETQLFGRKLASFTLGKSRRPAFDRQDAQ